MAHSKRASKRKRRIALPALGAAGVSSVMASSACATAPTADVPSLHDTSLRPVITLDEEESADVSLATFYVFDRENESQLGQGIRLAANCKSCSCSCRVAARCHCSRCGCAVRCGGCGCGGCGGCGGWWLGIGCVSVGCGGGGCWRWTPRGWVWVCY